uniref:Uncharacterized protein n=1 Tax=Triticum urartu TaxID=4572 RepID=A0A8R7UFQ8_TRIUA
MDPLLTISSPSHPDRSQATSPHSVDHKPGRRGEGRATWKAVEVYEKGLEGRVRSLAQVRQILPRSPISIASCFTSQTARVLGLIMARHKWR